MTNAFFTKETTDPSLFKPTDHCRGPWSANHCHAGPPTGLLARAMELELLSHSQGSIANSTIEDNDNPAQQLENKLARNAQRLTRITVELIRPIPFDGFRVHAQIERKGKTVSTATAHLISMEGKPVISARGLFMAKASSPIDWPSSVDKLIPSGHYGRPEEAINGEFPINATLHDLPAFNGAGVETRYIKGNNSSPGQTSAWLRTVPLFEDETPSPFQRICPLADCGNAFGRLAEPTDVTFMNTDLTVVLHRDPLGEWLGTNSACYWESNGIGLSDSQLFDKEGIVGRAVQTLLLR